MMPRNKDFVKAHSRAPRFRENTRFMQVHENMVDFLKLGSPSPSLLDAVASSFFGLDILTIDDENDLIYSDDDDDEVPLQDPYHQLQPHPRIKEQTDEEADQQAKELVEEEQRKGRRKKKNKQKKLRKKEKKRLEKESAEKNNLPEEEQEKSDSSESPEENLIMEKKTDSKDKPAVCNKTESESGCDELSKINKEEPEKNDKGEEATENIEVNTLYPSNTESVAEETHQYTQEIEEEKSQTVEDEEEEQGQKEEPEAGKEEVKGHRTEETKPDVIKEEPVDPTVLLFAQRSRDLAAAGNRLAAAEQYEMAVKYFTDAIKYNPREARLFGNRSLCLERLHQYDNALSDAEIALTMEPNWTKGLFRKGKALCGLKKYYEASLVYRDVLKLDSSSKEAMQELKRAQMLHLMEMGFTWAQSCDALKTHSTLEEAIEALFGGKHAPQASGGTSGATELTAWRPAQEDGAAQGDWTVQQTSRPRMHHPKESSSQSQPTPVLKSSTKPQMFSVWVGSLAPTITYTVLYEVFSRAGNVISIKMLLEQKCAFVNYATKQDSDRAIQCINGMVVEGVPLLVRSPIRNHTGPSTPKWAIGDGSGTYKKECFFWRTLGCNRSDCIYKHVPEHKGIDKEKFTIGFGTGAT